MVSEDEIYYFTKIISTSSSLNDLRFSETKFMYLP